MNTRQQTDVPHDAEHLTRIRVDYYPNARKYALSVWPVQLRHGFENTVITAGRFYPIETATRRNVHRAAKLAALLTPHAATIAAAYRAGKHETIAAIVQTTTQTPDALADAISRQLAAARLQLTAIE